METTNDIPGVVQSYGMTQEQKRLEALLLDFIEKETKAMRESYETIPQTALALVELWKLTDYHNPCR